MKKTAFTLLIIWSLISCGRESSPEGRFQIRYEALDQKLDSLQNQNSAILDSIQSINKELGVLRENKLLPLKQENAGDLNKN